MAKIYLMIIKLINYKNESELNFMVVEELIEYLKTLKQDAKVVVGDSQYPEIEIDKNTIEYIKGSNKYVIY